MNLISEYFEDLTNSRFILNKCLAFTSSWNPLIPITDEGLLAQVSQMTRDDCNDVKRNPALYTVTHIGKSKFTVGHRCVDNDNIDAITLIITINQKIIRMLKSFQFLIKIAEISVLNIA
ncbi:hypothetical protein RF11_03685 [Thelohanellus kitauei]|uniref:Uncharacterized protein n=1 Tax=Thelohanellus kitauei TaxID=669202 RepID=A0A0C2JWF6_THEKT|nr:hypothetical protein RF11_03685 [Thelohanellus kitauei]